MTTKFSNNFWEAIDKNGIAILMERIKGSKQTCEKMKNAYEARAILEEHYGKTLMQIYQKQKISHTENGTSKLAMESLQQEMISIAESHIQLSQHIRNTIATPLSTLINKQKTIRKELQASIQKLYSNRQHRIQAVRKAHKRHNFEIEKANLLVQQQSDEKDKLNTFQTAKMTIDKLKQEYDQALIDLDKVTEEWNKEWSATCQSFEDLEKERLEFFKTNLSNYAQLMIGCLEGEIKTCEQINTKAESIDPIKDLSDFVNENKTSQKIPTSMDYIKLAAYHEANGGKNEHKNEDAIKSEEPQIQKMDTTQSSAKQIDQIPNKKESQPTLVMGVMEVYPSDEEESDSEEYVTESEEEEEEVLKQEPKKKPEGKLKEEGEEPKQKGPAMIVKHSVSESIMKKPGHTDDEKVNKLRSAYQEIQGIKKEEPVKRISTVSPRIKPEESKTTARSTLMDRYKRSVSEREQQQQQKLEHKQEEDYHTSAALELDDMLRELDAKRIDRDDDKEEEKQYRQPDIKPTASISSPSHLEPRFRRSYQHKPNQFESSRRLSQLEPTKSTNFYDPFNSLSSKETGKSTTRQASPPSAQTMYDRMMSQKNINRRSMSSVSSYATSASPTGSMRQNDKFVENFYSIGSKTSSPFSTVSTDSSNDDNHFIDFALAQYDYEASDEGEIAFKEGDLLGIIMKGEDGGEGWWPASVLDPKTKKVVRTGLVPSNFLETISK